MRKQIFATAAMRRPIATADPREVNHAVIVKLALRIANATEQARLSRATASRMDYPSAQSKAFESWASSLDSDVCQLCIEMQRACRGEVGPFPSDSWSHLNEG
jgi:hypothetical protein